MQFTKLNQRAGLDLKCKAYKRYRQFENMLQQLAKRELPENLVSLINSEIESLNNISGTEKEWSKQLYKSQHKIMRKIEKDLKIVTKGYYTNMWMALGMSVFGLPMGLVFAFSLDNMAYLGIGLPIGMALGTAIGSGMDKKAKEEGRQIDCELQF